MPDDDTEADGHVDSFGLRVLASVSQHHLVQCICASRSEAVDTNLRIKCNTTLAAYCHSAVKELKLSYYIGETLLFTIYTNYGNLV